MNTIRKLGKVENNRVEIKENGLVSNYTVSQYKIYTTNCNESPIPNIVDRNFDNREKLKVAVSDLTYVRVADK